METLNGISTATSLLRYWLKESNIVLFLFQGISRPVYPNIQLHALEFVLGRDAERWQSVVIEDQAMVLSWRDLQRLVAKLLQKARTESGVVRRAVESCLFQDNLQKGVFGHKVLERSWALLISGGSLRTQQL